MNAQVLRQPVRSNRVLSCELRLDVPEEIYRDFLEVAGGEKKAADVAEQLLADYLQRSELLPRLMRGFVENNSERLRLLRRLSEPEVKMPTQVI